MKIGSIAVIFVILAFFALGLSLIGCGDDDDDDDSDDDDDDDDFGDDDANDDNVDCTFTELCTRSIECGTPWDSVDQCVESCENGADQYQDLDAYMSCACAGLAAETSCDEFEAILTDCWNNYGAP